MPQTCHQPAVRDAAVFIARLEAGEASAVRLRALLYLADRLAVRRHWHTISEDRFTNRDGVPCGVGTARIVASLCGRGRPRDLDLGGELSEADETILKDTHSRFVDMDDRWLVSYLKKLPEAGRGPISYADLALAVDPYKAVELTEKLETDRALRWCIEDSGCRIRTQAAYSPE